MGRLIETQYPLSLDEQTRQNFLSAGLAFKKLTKNTFGEGFSKVETTLDFENISNNIINLNRAEVSKLSSIGYFDDELELTIQRGVYLWKLNRMKKPNESGYPFEFLGKQPKTWETQTLVPAEIENLAQQLKQYGITQTRVGQELEFILPKYPIRGFNFWSKVKEAEINKLEFQISAEKDRAKIKALEEKLYALEDFNAREMLMYDMIELDPRTKKLLEPLFGTSHDGDGYYDGENCLELKIKHCDVKDYSEIQKTVTSVLVEKCAAYGLALDAAPHNHLSFSFWDKNGNIFDSTHPSYARKGKVLAEGILKGLYECMPLIANNSFMTRSRSKRSYNLNLSVHRSGHLRSAHGRIELRPSIHDIEEHTDIMIIPVMAGALYSLKHQKDCYYKSEFNQASLTENGLHKRPKNELKVLVHVLNSNEINKDGSLNIPENYIESSIEKLAFELGITNEKQKTSIFDLTFGGNPPYQKPLIEFFKKIHICRDGETPKIIFPETEKNVYSFTTPEINMDKIPKETAEKIRNGIDPNSIHHEFIDFIDVMEDFPKASQTYSIDIKKLKDSITLENIEKRLVIKDGYSIKEPFICPNKILNEHEAYLQIKQERLVTTDVLESSTSPEFRSKLLSVYKHDLMSIVKRPAHFMVKKQKP